MARHSNQGQYFVVEFWMCDLRHPPTKQYPSGKQLTANELHVFAMIFGFSKDGAGTFHGMRGGEGAKKYAASKLNASLSSIKDAFKNLERSGFIQEKNDRPKGSPIGEEWVVTDKAYRCTRNPSKPEIGLEQIDPSKTPDQTPENVEKICSKPEIGLEASEPEIGSGEGQKSAFPKPEIGFEGSENPQVKSENILPLNKGVNMDVNKTLIDRYDNDITELMDESLNKNSKFEVVKEAYLAAISKGYTPEQILKAYKASFIPRYRAENPDTTQKAFRLENWLSDSRGLRFDCPLSRSSKKSHSKDKAIPTNLSELNSWLYQHNAQYNAISRELTASFAKKTRLQLGDANEELISDIDSNISVLQKRLEDIRGEYDLEGVSAIEKKGI